MRVKIAEKSRRGISKRSRKMIGGFRAGDSALHIPGELSHPAKASKFRGISTVQLAHFLKNDFARAVKSFRKNLGISQEELARITGFSTRSVAGWESGQSFSSAGRQKLVEMERLRVALAEIMPPDALGDWLRQPNPAFENQPPLQVIERGETDRLWRMIFQIDAAVAN